MSAPSLAMQRVELVNYGFLATKAKNAVRTLKNRQQLSDEEKKALEKGHKFLANVVVGSNILRGDYSEDGNMLDAVGAFGLASDPIGDLSEALHEANLIDKLSTTAAKISIYSSADATQFDTEHMSDATLYEQFFELISVYVTNKISNLNDIKSSHSRSSLFNLYG